MRSIGPWLLQHPLVAAAIGGLIACVPTLEWLGLGLLTFAALQRWKPSAFIGLGFVLLSAAVNWYLFRWLISPGLLLLGLLLLLLFARTRNWHMLLLLSGGGGLGAMLLLPMLGLTGSWSPPEVLTTMMPQPMIPLPLVVPLCGYLVLTILLAAWIGRSLHARATLPGAFGREMQTLKLEVGSWILWPVLLAVAWQMAGVQALAVTGLPLVLIAFLAVWGLPLRRRRKRVLLAFYMLGCLFAWAGMILGLSAYAGMLVILPVLLDVLLDWRGRALVGSIGIRRNFDSMISE